MNLPLLALYLILIINFLYPFCVRYFGLPNLPTDSSEFLVLSLFVAIYIKSFLRNKIFNISITRIRVYKYFLLIFVSVAIINSPANSPANPAAMSTSTPTPSATMSIRCAPGSIPRGVRQCPAGALRCCWDSYPHGRAGRRRRPRAERCR